MITIIINCRSIPKPAITQIENLNQNCDLEESANLDFQVNRFLIKFEGCVKKISDESIAIYYKFDRAHARPISIPFLIFYPITESLFLGKHEIFTNKIEIKNDSSSMIQIASSSIVGGSYYIYLIKFKKNSLDKKEIEVQEISFDKENTEKVLLNAIITSDLENVKKNINKYSDNFIVYIQGKNDTEKHNLITQTVVANSKIEVMQYLIENRININFEGNILGEHMNPFLIAVSLERASIVEYLLEKYPQLINSKTNSGKTCLHMAVIENKNVNILKMLLKKGVNKDIRDKKGKTPLEYANELDKMEFKKLLSESF